MYNERDIKFDRNGDMELEDGDFKLATPKETVTQDIFNRVMTNNPDWYRYPDIAANLEDIFGMDNTFETGQEAINKVETALTKDGRFNSGDLNIDAVPTGKDKLEIFIFINTGEQEELVMKYPIRLR